MMVNIIVLGLIGIFLVYCLWDACRHFIGRNPEAPGFVKRLKVCLSSPPDGMDESRSKDRYK